MRKLAYVMIIFGLAFSFGCAKKNEEAPLVSKDMPFEGEAAEEAGPAPAAPSEEGGIAFKKADTTTAGKERSSDRGDTLIEGPEGGLGVPEADAADVAEIAGDLKLIMTADLTSEVDDVDQGFEAVYAVAKAEKALVVGTTRSVADEGYSYGSVTIKVHPSKYEETMRELRKVGRLLVENSTTEDVTQEYVDVQARLENAEAARDRYKEILATRTGSVLDILEVEREIERVTENIERFKGQLRYFDSQVGLSTITVHLEEPHAAVPSGYDFGKSLKKAFRIAVRICIFLLQAIIILTPFIIILLILLVFIRFVVWVFQRRRRKAKQAAAGV